MGNEPDDSFTIPAFLKRGSDNKAEYMSMSDSIVEVDTEHRPAASKPKAVKANGAVKAPSKAAGKLKAKAAPKAPVEVKAAPKPAVKASKGSEKPKTAKPQAETMPKDAFGFRKGSSKSEAAALYARKSGATLDEVKERVGSVQLNCLVTLEAEGYEVVRKKETREGQRPVTRYLLKPKI